MRILWHGVAPWHPTGYGTQAAIWCRKLRDAGHDVAVSAQGGNANSQVIMWEGIPVLPSALELVAVPMVMRKHITETRPDLAIILYDLWQMGPGEVWRDVRTLAWTPCDTDVLTGTGSPAPGGLGVDDRRWLQESGASPVAMSRHGKMLLEHAGHQDVPVIYHGIDTVNAWTPPEDRAALRKSAGIPDGVFCVGIAGTNIDPHRKSLPEQFAAFAKFHAKHPDSMLFVHSTVSIPGSLNLLQLRDGCGLGPETVRFSDQGTMFTGMFPQDMLAGWYGCMDVIMNCSHAEGFGLVAVEAQACGTPVILSRGHTGPELAGPAGWVVGGQEFWNRTFQSWWQTPSIKGMTEALEKAWKRRGDQQLRDACRRFAEGFDVDLVWPLWEKLIGETMS